MALFSTVSSPSSVLARSVFIVIFFATSLLLILAFCFLLQCNPVLKTLDQPPLSFFFKYPAKKSGILPLQTKGACLCQPISWSMAAILRDSVVAVAVITVVRTRPRAIPLAMITMRKSTHGFPFLPYMGMGFCLVALWAAGALLKILQRCLTYKFYTPGSVF